MDSTVTEKETEFRYNLKRLLREGFPQGIDLSELTQVYRRWFKGCPALPEELSVEYKDWETLFRNSNFLRRTFKIVKRKDVLYVKILPGNETGLDELAIVLELSSYKNLLWMRAIKEWSTNADTNNSGLDDQPLVTISDSDAEDDPPSTTTATATDSLHPENVSSVPPAQPSCSAASSAPGIGATSTENSTSPANENPISELQKLAQSKLPLSPEDEAKIIAQALQWDVSIFLRKIDEGCRIPPKRRKLSPSKSISQSNCSKLKSTKPKVQNRKSATSKKQNQRKSKAETPKRANTKKETPALNPIPSTSMASVMNGFPFIDPNEVIIINDAIQISTPVKPGTVRTTKSRSSSSKKPVVKRPNSQNVRKPKQSRLTVQKSKQSPITVRKPEESPSVTIQKPDESAISIAEDSREVMTNGFTELLEFQFNWICAAITKEMRLTMTLTKELIDSAMTNLSEWVAFPSCHCKLNTNLGSRGFYRRFEEHTERFNGNNWEAVGHFLKLEEEAQVHKFTTFAIPKRSLVYGEFERVNVGQTKFNIIDCAVWRGQDVRHLSFSRRRQEVRSAFGEPESLFGRPSLIQSQIVTVANAINIEKDLFDKTTKRTGEWLSTSTFDSDGFISPLFLPGSAERSVQHVDGIIFMKMLDGATSLCFAETMSSKLFWKFDSKSSISKENRCEVSQPSEFGLWTFLQKIRNSNNAAQIIN